MGSVAANSSSHWGRQPFPAGPRALRDHHGTAPRHHRCRPRTGPRRFTWQLLASAAATGMAVVTDEKYAGGADPSWQSDSTDAFRAAAATTLPVYVPPGAYRFAGPGIDVEAPTFIGAGQGFTTISSATAHTSSNRTVAGRVSRCPGFVSTAGSAISATPTPAQTSTTNSQ